MKWQKLIFAGAIILLAAVTMLPAQMKFYMTGQYTWDGFYDPNHINAAPDNWKSPVDYYNGSMYMRYEVFEKPSDQTVALQLCMWQDDYTKESCGRMGIYSGTKALIYVKMPAIPTWYNKSGGAIDWTKPMQKTSIMHKANSYGGTLLAYNACGKACYKGTDIHDHIPIKYTVSAFLVPKGGTFTQPALWPDCPTEWGCTKQTGIKESGQLAESRRQAPLTAALSPNPVKDMVTVTIKGSRQGHYTFTVMDNSGNLVREISTDQKVLYWDGKDGKGQQVKPGCYLYTVTDGINTATGKMLKTE